MGTRTIFCEISKGKDTELKALSHILDVSTRDAYAIVACRGKSFEILEKNEVWKNCDVAFFVNDWETSPPKAIIEHGHKVINYLTDLDDRQARWKKHGVHELRSSDALDFFRKNLSEEYKDIKPSFMNLWNTKDTGLRAISIASLFSSRVVVVGLDFWESPYWSMGKWTYYPGKIKKGLGNSPRYITAFLDYMKKKDDTVFEVFTYSRSLQSEIAKYPASNMLIVDNELKDE